MISPKTNNYNLSNKSQVKSPQCKSSATRQLYEIKTH